MKRWNLAVLLLAAGGVAAKPAKSPRPKVTIKVGVFENLYTEDMTSEMYIEEYRHGLALGQRVFSEPALEIELREFGYGSDEKSIVETARQLLEWQPHVIIGPASSHMFVRIPAYFHDRVVLSALATADEVEQLAPHFHSLSFTNKTLARGLAWYVERNFPHARIFPIVQVDCKNCVGFSESFRSVFSAGSQGTMVLPTILFLKEPSNKDLSDLSATYRKGDLVLIPNHAGVSGKMVASISDLLKENVTFIGNDNWGDWKSGYIGKFPSLYKYRGIRVVSHSLLLSDIKTKSFLDMYQKSYKREPLTVSYLCYRTIELIRDVAKRLVPDKVNHETFMQEFLRLKKARPYLGKGEAIFVHETTQEGESFVSAIPLHEVVK